MGSDSEYMGSDSTYHWAGSFSIEDGTLDRAQGSAVAEGEADEAGRSVILINRV